MYASDHYIICSPGDSSRLFENNCPANFLFELPHELQLKGVWEMGLVEVSMQPNIDFLGDYWYVFCDAVQSSIVKQQFLPFMRRFPVQNYSLFEPVYYRKLLSESLKRIHVYITNDQLQSVSFDDLSLTYTFHLRPVLI